MRYIHITTSDERAISGLISAIIDTKTYFTIKAGYTVKYVCKIFQPSPNKIVVIYYMKFGT